MNDEEFNAIGRRILSHSHTSNDVEDMWAELRRLRYPHAEAMRRCMRELAFICRSVAVGRDREVAAAFTELADSLRDWEP